MATYDEYIAQGIDPVTARAWADVDTQEEEAAAQDVRARTGRTTNRADSRDRPRQITSDLLGAYEEHLLADGDSVSAGSRTGPAPQRGSEHQPSAFPLTAGQPDESDSGRDMALGEALRDLQLHTGRAPHPAIGRDSSGVVGVHVDEDHRPVRLELHSDWTDELSGASLAGAILAAYSAALKIQYEAARDATSYGSGPQLLDIDTDRIDRSEIPRSPESIHADIEVASEHALHLTDLLREDSAKTVRDKESATPPRTMTVVLNGPWLVGCTINADWVEHAATSRIMDEFYNALQNAREAPPVERGPKLARLNEARELTIELGRLSREAFASLHRMVKY